MTTVFCSISAVMATLLLLFFGVALLPAALVACVLVFAFSLVAGAIGLVFRLIGGVLMLLLAAPLLLLGGVFALAVVAAALHAALPLLVVIGIVWLIARHSRGNSPRASGA